MKRNERRSGPTSQQEIKTSNHGDPLAATRERGNNYALIEWSNPNNLKLADAAAYYGRSTQTIEGDVEKKKLYALRLWGRGFRYPRWQFDVETARLEPVLQALNKVGFTNCWIIHNFLMHPHPRFGNVSPFQIISDKNKSIEPILSAIEERFGRDGSLGT